jgi:hypothetical protein
VRPGFPPAGAPSKGGVHFMVPSVSRGGIGVTLAKRPGCRPFTFYPTTIHFKRNREVPHGPRRVVPVGNVRVGVQCLCICG